MNTWIGVVNSGIAVVNAGIAKQVTWGVAFATPGPGGRWMATERLPMSKTREILRLRWALGRSVRETSRAVHVSVGVIAKMVQRAERAGLDWAAVERLDDVALERQLYGDESVCRFSPSWSHSTGKFFSLMEPADLQGHGAT